MTPYDKRNLLKEKEWLINYFERYRSVIFQDDCREDLIALKDLLVAIQGAGKKVMIAGNGGSAGIASHCAIDFTKNAGIRMMNFNEPGLITCLANDFGYERWVEKAVDFHADEGDALILISSSGQSSNMIRAARLARQRGIRLMTFTGFAEDNLLKGLGELNFWVPSRAYNIVEMAHQIWLLAVCDLIIGCAEYPAVAKETTVADKDRASSIDD